MDLKGLSQQNKQRAKEAVGELLVDEIESFLDESKSPVKNGKFKRTLKDGRPSNLLDEGRMRSELDFEVPETDHVDVGIFETSPQVEKDKALGHNSGFKGHPNQSKMKKFKREFIPAPNKTFKQPIKRKIKDVVDSIKNEQAETERLARQVLEEFDG